MRVRPAERFELGWLQQRAKCVLTPQAHGLACVDAYGQLRAMVGVDDITRGSCEMHLAVESPMALRTLAPAVARSLFWGLKLSVALGHIPADNARCRALVQHLGFRETYRVRDGWAAGVDMLLYEWRAEDCARWLREPMKEVA